MVRAICGVIVGYAVWTVIWLGGGALLFKDLSATVAEGERVDSVGPLAGLLVLSIVCSLVGGLACGVIARPKANGSTLVLAALLLLTGIGVQASTWSTMPVWYHLSFLVLLVPMTMAGGRMVTPKNSRRH